MTKTTQDYYEEHDYEDVLSALPDLLHTYLYKEDEFLHYYISSLASVLEIGCGFGRSLEVLGTHAQHVVGIDLSRTMLQKAQEHLPCHIDVALMPATRLAFANNTFDYVVALGHTFGNLEHIEAQVLQEMYRVTKKEVYISVLGTRARSAQQELYTRNGFTIIEDTLEYTRLKEGLYSRRFRIPDLVDLLATCNIKKFDIVPLGEIAYQIRCFK